MKYMKLGFLASHGGTNMQAIIDSCKAKELQMIPAVIISNNSGSTALERARKEGIPWYHLSSNTHPEEGGLDSAIHSTLTKHHVDLVILAGYMKKIGKETLSAFRNRILNIHPGLLPRVGGKGMYGLNVHQAVLDSGERETGITIHLVDEKYDHGMILNQTRIPVLEHDTPESLQLRVLKIEHSFYVETLQKISTGKIALPD